MQSVCSHGDAEPVGPVNQSPPDTLKISIVPDSTSRVKGRKAEGPISAVRALAPWLSHSIRKHHHGLDWADQSHERTATPL